MNLFLLGTLHINITTVTEQCQCHTCDCGNLRKNALLISFYILSDIVRYIKKDASTFKKFGVHY